MTSQADMLTILKDALEGDTGVPDVWEDTELNFLLDSALATVNNFRPRSLRDTIDLESGTDAYALVTVHTVTAVDWLDADGKAIMRLPGRVWEVWGDNESATQTLWINLAYARDGYSVRVHGYGPYTWEDTPDFTYQVQALIIAVARAEALRRLTSERTRFRQWATSNPRSDVSVTELLSTTNEADNYAREMLQRLRIIKKPTTGRR